MTVSTMTAAIKNFAKNHKALQIELNAAEVNEMHMTDKVNEAKHIIWPEFKKKFNLDAGAEDFDHYLLSFNDDMEEWDMLVEEHCKALMPEFERLNIAPDNYQHCPALMAAKTAGELKTAAIHTVCKDLGFSLSVARGGALQSLLNMFNVMCNEDISYNTMIRVVVGKARQVKADFDKYTKWLESK